MRTLLLSLLLAACSNSMFSGDNAKEGMEAIATKLEAKDLLISRVKIQTDQIEVFAQHPKNPDALTVVYYTPERGVTFGGGVDIIGGGSAKDVGFRAATIDFGLVPKIVEAVKSKTSSPVKLIVINHGLVGGPAPSFWSVEIEGGDLALFKLDGTLDSFTTRAEREKMGARF
jgi:hypothetical protein